ncbi:MAG: PspC domain-containing protein [Streptosporangiales bacterium]|nr:PspC domain-containing protein [Streptosporangiales bacterium]
MSEPPNRLADVTQGPGPATPEGTEPYLLGALRAAVWATPEEPPRGPRGDLPTRSSADRKIAGVCSGLAHYIGMQPGRMRLLFLVLVPLWPVTALVYLLLFAVMSPDQRRANRRWRVLPWVIWVLFVFGMTAGSIGQMFAMGAQQGLAWGVGLLQCAPLVVAAWSPLIAWRLMTVGVFLGGLGALQPEISWPWPATTCISYLLVLYLVGARYDRRVLAGAGAVTTLIVLPARYTADMGGFIVFVAIAVALAVLVAGDNVRTRRAAQRDLAEQEELRRRDLSRQAVLEERSRIARELHDVVAHHMSMIAIQAEAAPYKIPDLPDPARVTFGVIRDASREALTEMRRVVGLLRQQGEGAERLPQPGMDRLDELAKSARQAGMHVRVEVRGVPRPLGPAVDVSAYRIVQEALSNAGRYAPGANVDVEVAYEPELLRLRVSDDGTARPAGEPGGGHGLVGMRERAMMLGGTLHTGPREPHGFTVEAELPLDELTTAG